MEIKLILHTLGASWGESQFFIANNETLKITLIGDSRTDGQKCYLRVNNALFAFDGNKKLELPSEYLQEVNYIELQTRNEKGKVLNEIKCENLYRPAFLDEIDTNFLDTERQLLETIKALANKVDELSNANRDNAEAIKNLQDGKFTVLQFSNQED